MCKAIAARYDVAEHLRTHEERVAYLQACVNEADGNAAFITKALNDIVRSRRLKLKEEVKPCC